MNQEAKKVSQRTVLMAGLALATLLAAAPARGSSVTLNWNPSPDSGVSYRLYFGGASGAYTNHVDVGTNLTATVNNLVGGATYYFTSTCYAKDGTESAYSNEVSYRMAPQPPALRQDQVLVEVPVSFWSSTNLGLPNWQVLGGSSAWLLVPATNQQEFFSATSSALPGQQLQVTIKQPAQ